MQVPFGEDGSKEKLGAFAEASTCLAASAKAIALSSCEEGEGACLGKQPNEQMKLKKKKD